MAQAVDQGYDLEAIDSLLELQEATGSWREFLAEEVHGKSFFNDPTHIFGATRGGVGTRSAYHGVAPSWWGPLYRTVLSAGNADENGSSRLMVRILAVLNFDYLLRERLQQKVR